jgi:hypothetical protein
MSLLDECRALWDRLTSAHPWAAEAWHVAQAMRPAWWVLRAWLAVQLLDLTLGPAEYLTFLPSLGNQVAGALVLVLAVVVSVLVGTGRLRPDGPPLQAWRSRLALLVLNAFAVAIALPLVLGGFPDAWDSHRLANGAVYSQGRPETPPGLRSGGHYIRNVFAYDTEGKPLTGVQLYDQVGRPLAVSQDTYLRSYRTAGGPVRTYPWHNGDHELFNVYPLPVREEGGMRPVRDPWGTSRPPTLPSGPMAVVPPVALPTPTAAQPQVTPAPGASPVPSGRTSPSTDSEKTRPR